MDLRSTIRTWNWLYFRFMKFLERFGKVRSAFRQFFSNWNTTSPIHKGIMEPSMEHYGIKKITILDIICYCVGQANNGRIVSRLGVRNAHRLYFVGSNAFYQNLNFGFWIFSWFFMFFSKNKEISTFRLKSEDMATISSDFGRNVGISQP